MPILSLNLLNNMKVKSRKILSWISAIIFIVFVMISDQKENNAYEIIEIFGYSLIIIGALGRLWCSIYICGYKNKEIIMDGPYSICRNPLYLFSFVSSAGILAGSKNIMLLLFFIPVYCIYHYFVVKNEEQKLKINFGIEYEKYCEKVNRFIPSFKNYFSRETVVVYPDKMFRAIIDSMWFFWMFILLEIIEYIKLNGII